MTTITRIFDLLPNYVASYKPKDDALACKEDGVWKKYSIEQYIRMADDLTYGLLSLGVKKGDAIATITNNRPEWNFLDMAIMQAGAIHVPVYPTISAADYQYIFNHASIKFVFVSGEELARKIKEVSGNCPSVEEVFTFKQREGFRNFYDLVGIGQAGPLPEKVQAIKESIQGEDLATIIYTSGTTGNPKGVMLSHTNIISNFVAVSYIPTFGEEGKALSFLPLCHVYERMLNYLYQYLGISVYYAESLATITDNIKEIHPDMMCCVPRLLEKIYDKIQATGRKLKGVKRMIFFWAVDLALHYDVQGKNNAWYMLKHRIADKLIYSKWREALGGNFKIIVSGGASIQPRLVKTFRAAGLPIYEGYGLTETSPVIAVTSTDSNGIKIGTVGPPLRGVEVMIAEDGEILARGPNIMMGYYKDPELTAQVIDQDGWFHTGDIGMFEPEGQLRITGRKKEIFKTSLGKYIAPELLENKIKESPFIDNIMVVGENQKFAAALVVPDFNHLRSWCRIKEIEYTTDEEMVSLPRIRQRLLKVIDKYNKEFGSTEQIKKIDIMSTEWSTASGELTPTLKLRRAFITNKYQTRIEKLFS
ncbi:long-chain fatty acid--CoA ligase [Lentimicrobium sp.]|jgi:long-chain acyl-CoA synthetase|uniref:AMP-dependent synthetase/ligase n=1 Tax=Lentimicrobium sp. TaxID=2034841 RepID=UPI0025ED1B37|nr:long-chain fatty acid--CoA ligase [Lentimicrobium sp.]MCO5257014.1 long-chain fatty acid--CoA ligase [Lentimicrobium sp.]HPR26848.1 long-chain fatty acid--CoA ligase [Lentimicrobium sp.]HRW68185.1 long-chain fatty acid--CoA ligase [Lentimicrobium sp.]